MHRVAGLATVGLGDAPADVDVESKVSTGWERLRPLEVAGPSEGGREQWKLQKERFLSQKKTEEQLQGLRHRASRHFKPNARNAIVGFYLRQNETVDQFQEMDSIHERLLESNEATTSNQEEKHIVLAMHLSNAVNLGLFGIKILACVLSGSLAIIASTLDSFLDLLSGFILFFTAWSMRHVNWYDYPIGKTRMEPLGIVVFASIMGTVGFQVALEGARQLLVEHTHHLEHLVWLVTIMVAVVVIKFFLWMYCSTFKNDTVRAYAQDHLNDVLTNGIGLSAAVLADYFFYWIDPLGAILLSIFIIKTWSLTALENVRALVGQSAPPEFLQKITYLCWNHHPGIKKIDTVKAYTFGKYYFAEVDVVLPGDMPLQEAHDIGEALQEKLESLPDVERAFVHLDYEVSHRPEHSTLRRNLSARGDGADTPGTPASELGQGSAPESPVLEMTRGPNQSEIAPIS